jgi:hypothetical protein
VQITTELYASLDEAFRKAFGFTATDVIAVAQCLTSTLESRGSERLNFLRRIFRDRKINRVVRRFFEDYPHVDGDPEEFIRNIPASASREAVIARLLSPADLALVTFFTTPPQDVSLQLGLPAEIVTKVLGALSLKPAALQNDNVEHFFLSNPIWRSPIIDIGNAFFCVMPQGIFSHLHEIMRRLAEMAGLKTALEERRAAYLENRVEKLLVAALPAAQLRHGIRWRDGDATYETDHLAAIDKRVVIVEDKSAALTAPGLRGAPDRVKRHVRELVLDPSEQSTRLEAMIAWVKAGEASAVASLGSILARPSELCGFRSPWMIFL